jgi:hypothetical protein
MGAKAVPELVRIADILGIDSDQSQ